MDQLSISVPPNAKWITFKLGGTRNDSIEFFGLVSVPRGENLKEVVGNYRFAIIINKFYFKYKKFGLDWPFFEGDKGVISLLGSDFYYDHN